MLKEPHHQKREVTHRYSAIEVSEMSSDLSRKNIKKDELESKKKSLQSEISAEIKKVQTDILVLSNAIQAGKVDRTEECTVEFHTPSENMKTLTVLSTGEKIVDRMNGEDIDEHNEIEAANSQLEFPFPGEEDAAEAELTVPEPEAPKAKRKSKKEKLIDAAAVALVLQTEDDEQSFQDLKDGQDIDESDFEIDEPDQMF